MTTDLAPTSNLDALLDSYDGELPEQTGTGLGTCYWLHGSNKGGAKTPGVLYVKDTEIADIPGPPWQNDGRYEDQENPEHGFSAAQIKIAPIIWHAQWYLPDRDEDDQPRKGRRGPKKWIQGYQDGAQKHLDLICLVEGLSDPMVISADGQNKCGALLDILSKYRNGLLRQATMRARKSGRRTPPPWAYWLPIANKKTADGKIDYQKVIVNGVDRGAVVTPPALFLPPDAIDSLLVTPEQFKAAADLYFAFQEWSKEPRVYVEQPVPQLTSGRNVPQPVDDAEYAFDEPPAF